jgi:hypothetical protein
MRFASYACVRCGESARLKRPMRHKPQQDAGKVCALSALGAISLSQRRLISTLCAMRLAAFVGWVWEQDVGHIDAHFDVYRKERSRETGQIKASSFGGLRRRRNSFLMTAPWAHFPPGLRSLSCAGQSEPIL